MRDQLHQLLATLRFQGMAQTLDRELDRAEREALTPQEVLYHLLVEEARDRQERSLAYRLRQAKLPWDWTLETFPFERCPELSKAHILSLAGLDFVERAQNISGPIHSIQARFSQTGDGAPVHITRVRDDRSKRSRSAGGSRQMRCIMVGTKRTHSTRCFSISASASRASKRSITTTRPPQRICCQAVMKGPA